jgi:hypothetical protein
LTGSLEIDLLPPGYWPSARLREILDKTVTVELAAGLDGLSPGQLGALDRLIAVNRLMQDVYEDQLHHQALAARDELIRLHEETGRGPRTQDLLAIWDLSNGPIAVTLENERLPFVPVDGFTQGKNVYPWGITEAEVEEHLAAHPGDRAAIHGLRTVVRRATPENLKLDLATLRRHPGLALLHPGLAERLRALRPRLAGPRLYSVPFAVRWAEPMLAAARLLREAADQLPVDDDFGQFLRQRAVDLLTDEYEPGDAAWVRGRPGPLNAVIGAYETYDDSLYGAKAFYGVSLYRRDEARTRALEEALRHLQAMEDALPYESQRVVSRDIPVGAYDVIADSGSQRNVAAQILPNEARLTRKYGRTIMLRQNVIANPAGLVRQRDRWAAALAPAHRHQLTEEGRFQQVLWHEIGHYLGPLEDRAAQLEEEGVLLEELKAELISVRAADHLHARGLIGPEVRAGIRASAILAMLRPVRPVREQTYETLWTMMLNYWLASGALELAPDGLRIHADVVAGVVEAMLREVLAFLDGGAKPDATAFIERWSTWGEHNDRIAAAVRSVERYRFSRYVYPVLRRTVPGVPEPG